MVLEAFNDIGTDFFIIAGNVEAVANLNVVLQLFALQRKIL